MGFSKVIADAIFDSIKPGIHSINHFEELGILMKELDVTELAEQLFTYCFYITGDLISSFL
jgi:hypothetical protein